MQPSLWNSHLKFCLFRVLYNFSLILFPKSNLQVGQLLFSSKYLSIHFSQNEWEFFLSEQLFGLFSIKKQIGQIKSSLFSRSTKFSAFIFDICFCPIYLFAFSDNKKFIIFLWLSFNLIFKIKFEIKRILII